MHAFPEETVQGRIESTDSVYEEHILRGVPSLVAIVYFLWVRMIITTMNMKMETATAPMFRRLAVVA